MALQEFDGLRRRVDRCWRRRRRSLGTRHSMSSAMVEIQRKYRHVVRDMDRHGNVRFYLRRPGHPKIRLRASPQSPAFDAEYRAGMAETGGDDPQPRSTTCTYRWLCHQYFQSVEFKRLDPGTQRTRRLILESTWDEPSAPGASTQFGDCPLDRMTSKIIRILRDRKADFPHAANGRLKAIRRVFKWAIEAEHAEENPAEKVAYLQTPPAATTRSRMRRSSSSRHIGR